MLLCLFFSRSSFVFNGDLCLVFNADLVLVPFLLFLASALYFIVVVSIIQENVHP